MSNDQSRLGRPETFLWQADKGIVTVTLNRPERLNALARQMQLELASSGRP